MAAMAMMASRLMAKRIDETSSTASVKARPCRRFGGGVSITVVLMRLASSAAADWDGGAEEDNNKKGGLLALPPFVSGYELAD